MIELIFTKQALKESERVPSRAREKLGSSLELLRDDPFHPLLHTKPLTQNLSGYYSFRITREWRVIFEFLDPHNIKILSIGHRKEAYKKIK